MLLKQEWEIWDLDMPVLRDPNMASVSLMEISHMPLFLTWETGRRGRIRRSQIALCVHIHASMPQTAVDKILDNAERLQLQGFTAQIRHPTVRAVLEKQMLRLSKVYNYYSEVARLVVSSCSPCPMHRFAY